MTLSSLDVSGPAGRLEALLDLPAGPPRAAALLCHPHPLHGGTMHTHAVFRAMRALRAGGHAVLRFNFRGVGRSEGRHDFGTGEREDARAALAELRRRFPGLPTVCGGFSFGSWVGLSVGAEERADALLGIGLPCQLYAFGELATARAPKALIHAERDELCAREAVETLAAGLPPPIRLWVVPGASHLFVEALDRYEQVVGEAAAWLLPDSRSTR
ncbi:MAG: alpha/beta hydrolase [Myxococcales bacterium]